MLYYLSSSDLWCGYNSHLVVVVVVFVSRKIVQYRVCCCCFNLSYGCPIDNTPKIMNEGVCVVSPRLTSRKVIMLENCYTKSQKINKNNNMECSTLKFCDRSHRDSTPNWRYSESWKWNTADDQPPLTDLYCHDREWIGCAHNSDEFVADRTCWQSLRCYDQRSVEWSCRRWIVDVNSQQQH